jgi:ATP-dependent Clp protease ATP-binding subunit ClpC
MVFERMSEDCIGAIVTAQKESYKLGLKQVEPPVLVAGIVDRPENTKQTLQGYGITWRRVTKALKELYPPKDEGEKASSLSSFFSAKSSSASSKKDDLPFSSLLRKNMVEAARLADQMKSPTIHSEHVFLALLEYDGPTTTTKATSSSSSETITPMTVIHKMEGIDPTLTALDICQTLLQDLKERNEKELLVTAGGGSGGSGSKLTPTLEQVGVDLTLLAKQNRLDIVEGREEEINSCLRTLVRRRKNNPCLIGEPGVGKGTSYVCHVCVDYLLYICIATLVW